MDDSFFVGSVESVGDFNADFHTMGDGHRAAVQNLVEGFTFEKFHGDEGAAIAFFDRMNRADAMVVQGRSGTRFAEKTIHCSRVVSRALFEEFQGDAPAQLGVFGFIDQSHAARSQFADDTIVGDFVLVHLESLTAVFDRSEMLAKQLLAVNRREGSGEP
jgi:hypothetical protein